MKFGEIYLVKFEPSFGREYKKIRPGIVVQQEEISQLSPYVTVMPLSSHAEHVQAPDIFVAKDKKNRLAKNSIIKVRQISSFDTKRLIKKVGVIDSPTTRRVRGYIRKHFGL